MARATLVVATLLAAATEAMVGHGPAAKVGHGPSANGSRARSDAHLPLLRVAQSPHPTSGRILGGSQPMTRAGKNTLRRPLKALRNSSVTAF